jgi:DtxR family Mn-dependent transcriptional regulator
LEISIGTQIRLIEQITFDQSLIISINNAEPTTVSSKFGENILIS